jgi:hypothetical protein
VVFNATVTQLWTRTTISLGRALAAQCGLSTREFGRRYRSSYAKVVEFQRRGAVHVHAAFAWTDGTELVQIWMPPCWPVRCTQRPKLPERPILSDHLNRSGGVYSWM